MNLHSLFNQLVSKRCRSLVIASYAHAPLAEPTRQGAHANAANAEEIDAIVVAQLHLISFSISFAISTAAFGFAIFEIFCESFWRLDSSPRSSSARTIRMSLACAS